METAIQLSVFRLSLASFLHCSATLYIITDTDVYVKSLMFEFYFSGEKEK